MKGTREAIDVALLARLNTISVAAPYALATPGTRHVYNVQQTPPANQPTFYQCKIAENPDQQQAIGLTKFVSHYRIIFFLKIDPTNETAPATAANAILDAMDVAIKTVPPNERQTLGGLVINAWIEGNVWILGGITDQQMEIEIPIKAVVGN